LHIKYTAGETETETDGWVQTGHLDIAPEVRFSAVSINTELPDADLANIPSETLQTLYAPPVIPTISAAMREVYERGQALGNDPQTVTKVGDSVTVNALYLKALRQHGYALGPYDYLEGTIRFFADALVEDSAAARIGLTAFGVFDPIWASPKWCDGGETPLACEYRRRLPSIALIMFGPNDVGVLNSEQYETQMRLLVDETLVRGIIPVLSTFSANPDAKTWEQAVHFNQLVIEIAADYDLPLMNLWAAARSLPGYGLGYDNTHLTSVGLKVNLATGYEADYGVTLQNLVALVTLDELRRTVINADS
ncbi:MAG TPA: SGNH/GDSL hydrolase family protein, partial [Phototrophicaceae bacterium]|nr:SGNH/GDSL hydrolase family protein [Phototrophicaceae bacterium]